MGHASSKFGSMTDATIARVSLQLYSMYRCSRPWCRGNFSMGTRASFPRNLWRIFKPAVVKSKMANKPSRGQLGGSGKSRQRLPRDMYLLEM